MSEMLGNISSSSKTHIKLNNTCEDSLKAMQLVGITHIRSCQVWEETCRTCESKGGVKYNHGSLTLRV